MSPTSSPSWGAHPGRPPWPAAWPSGRSARSGAEQVEGAEGVVDGNAGHVRVAATERQSPELRLGQPEGPQAGPALGEGDAEAIAEAEAVEHCGQGSDVVLRPVGAVDLEAEVDPVGLQGGPNGVEEPFGVG